MGGGRGETRGTVRGDREDGGWRECEGRQEGLVKGSLKKKLDYY